MCALKSRDHCAPSWKKNVQYQAHNVNRRPQCIKLGASTHEQVFIFFSNVIIFRGGGIRPKYKWKERKVKPEVSLPNERRKRIYEVKKERMKREKKWKHQNELNVNKSRVSHVSSLHLLRLHVISQSKESRDDKDYEWRARMQEGACDCARVVVKEGRATNQSI